MTIRFSQKTMLMSLILLATMVHGATAREFRVKDYRLASCTNSPNGVCTLGDSEEHAFVDDVEILFDDASKIIHFRSASRVGYSDFGVNRRRMEEVRSLLEGKL